MPSAVFTDSRFRLDYTVSFSSPDVANNRSLKREYLAIVKTGSSSAWSNNTSSYGCSAQGGQFTYNFGGTSVLVLVDRHDWVGHNADGTLSVASSAWVNADAPLGSASIGTFWTAAPTIPRATTPSVSGGFTTGQAATISLPRASSSFTHDVSWAIGTKSGTIATGAGVSTTWTPPHEIMTELPNAASGQVKLTTVTKSGGTVIGSKDAMIPLTAGAAVAPTVSAVMWDDANTTVKTNIGAFVQGASLIKGAVTAAGIHGSAIASKSVTVSGSVFPEGQVFQIATSGTIVASGKATDMRGRQASLAANFVVLPYEVPKLGSGLVQVRRANVSNVPADNGQYLRVDLHAIATSLKPAAVEKNALTISVRTRPKNGAWTARQTINPGLVHNGAFQVSGGAVFLVSQSYEIEITISDKTGASPLVVKSAVATSIVTVDMNGASMGVGKYHERGAIDVAGDGYAANWRADGGVYAGGAILDPIGSAKLWFADSAPQGWLLLRGQAVSRTTYAVLFALLGTTYGAGNGSTTFNLPDMRGRVPVGVSSTDIDFGTLGARYGAKTHTLVEAEMPTHKHSFVDGSHTFLWGTTKPSNVTFGVQALAQSTQGNNLMTSQGAWSESRTAGSSSPHNNIQPSIALNFIIRAL